MDDIDQALTEINGRLSGSPAPARQGLSRPSLPTPAAAPMGGEDGVVELPPVDVGDKAPERFGEGGDQPTGIEGSDGGYSSPGVEPGPLPGNAAAGVPDIDAALAEVNDRLGTIHMVTPEQEAEASTMDNYLGGFIGKAAERLGMPVDLLNSGLEKIAEEILPKMQEVYNDHIEKKGIGGKVLDTATTLLQVVNRQNFHPGEVSKLFKEYLEKAGIPASYTEDSLAGEIGAQTFDGLLTLAVLRAGAPAMAARTGTNVMSAFVRHMGEMMIKHPWLAASVEVTGASPGAVIGERQTGSPWGAIPGAIIGGSVIQGGLNAARGMGKLAFRGATKLAEATGLKNRPVPPARTPLRDPSADPANAGHFATEQIAGDTLRMENEITAAISRIQRITKSVRGRNIDMSSREIQAHVYKQLQEAEDISDRIVTQYWNRVPGGTKVPLGDLLTDVERHLVSVSQNSPSAVPGTQAFVKRLQGLFIRRQSPDGTGFMPQQNTVRILRDIRGQIYRARKDEAGKLYQGQAPNERLLASYSKLEDIIDNHIADALPDDTVLQQARAISIQHHNLFTRGVIPSILARSRMQEGTRPSQTVDEIMKSYEGLQDVLKMTSQLRNTRSPTTATGHPGPRGTWLATSPAERAQLEQIEGTIADSMRQEFHEVVAANVSDPTEIRKWLARLEPSIKPLARLSREFSEVGQRLASITDEQQLIARSALARFTKSDSTKAIQQIFNAGKPSDIVGELVYRMRGDADALSGLKAGIIDEVFSPSRLANPEKLQQFVASPRIKDMLNRVLAPDEVTRLDKMVQVAASVSRGDYQTFGQAKVGTISMIARILTIKAHGAIGGGGGLQIPAMLSSRVKDAVQTMFEGIDAGTLLSNAIRDPKWEAMLLKKEPATTAQAHDLVNFTKRWVRRIEGVREAGAGMVNENDDSPTPAPRDPSPLYLRLTPNTSAIKERPFVPQGPVQSTPNPFANLRGMR